jgi:hypothetical protein
MEKMNQRAKGWMEKKTPEEQAAIKLKMSQAGMGRIPANKGKTPSEETRKKMVLAKARIHEEAMRRKEVKNCLTCGNLLRINQDRFCSRSCTMRFSLASKKLIPKLSPQNIEARNIGFDKFRKDNPTYFKEHMTRVSNELTQEQREEYGSVGGCAATFNSNNLPPKPLHDKYDINGVRLRSRPELALAKILNALNLPWQYETQVQYTKEVGREACWYPDFFLPTLNMYVECKGVFRWMGDKERASNEWFKLRSLSNLKVLMEDAVLRYYAEGNWTLESFLCACERDHAYAVILLEKASKHYLTSDEPIFDELDLVEKTQAQLKPESTPTL